MRSLLSFRLNGTYKSRQSSFIMDRGYSKQCQGNSFNFNRKLSRFKRIDNSITTRCQGVSNVEDHFITSALTGENVENAFHKLASLARSINNRQTD